MNTTALTEPDVLTEVPASLKKLVRYIARGFYSIEHGIIIDILVHHPCIKEDDLCELIKYEKKPLRAYISTLKSDKFLKSRTMVETTSEGKPTHHNYYFINYSSFVNVVKYKLDCMRKKIEMQERESTSRASFKCPSCQKTFTDLETDRLLDFNTGLLRCTLCQSEVEEEESVVPRTDARTLMVKFNEQMEPLFVLLREVEDIKLSASILEPEPTDIKHTREHKGSSGRKDGMWSGDLTRRMDYGITENQVTIQLEGQDNSQKVQQQLAKERPEWMVKSTIEGAEIEGDDSMEPTTSKGSSKDTSAALENGLIMKTLLAYENKNRGPKISGVDQGASNDETSSSSDSEDETMNMPTTIIVEEPKSKGMDVVMEEEEEDETVFVTVGGKKIPYDDVDEQIIEKMTPSERDAYIALGQKMYGEMYD